MKRPEIVDQLLNTLLVITTINFFVVSVLGGYAITAGPLRLSAHRITVPFLLVLSLVILKLWHRGKRRGLSTRDRLNSQVLVILSLVLIYSLNARNSVTGDSVPARYLPLSLIREFDFDLDEFTFLYEHKIPYYLVERDGHIVSAYPPWAGVLALPVYIVPVLGGIASQSPRLRELEKLSAVLIAALSVSVLYCTLRRLTDVTIARAVSITYALGTSTFSTSSQALWQHGPGQLFLCTVIYCLVRGLQETRFVVWAGLALASAVICRPLNILITLPIVAYVLHKHRDQFIGFLLATLPPLFLFLAYNRAYFGSAFTTGFNSSAVDLLSLEPYTSAFRTPFHEGLLGILVSPGRGLLTYSPVLVFSLLGIALVWRQPGNYLFKYLSCAPLPVIIVLAQWNLWWGGHCYGPRLLAEITPFLCVFLIQPLERFSQSLFVRRSFGIFLILSIGLHTIGVLNNGSWNVDPNDVDVHPERLWSWHASPPVYYMKRWYGTIPTPTLPTSSETAQTLGPCSLQVAHARSEDPECRRICLWSPNQGGQSGPSIGLVTQDLGELNQIFLPTDESPRQQTRSLDTGFASNSTSNTLNGMGISLADRSRHGARKVTQVL